MHIDRRQVVTGLAAVAVTGVAPALPAMPLPQHVRYGRAFTPEDSEADRLVWSARRIFWTSRWHVHLHSPTEQTYRHVDSGGVLLATDPNKPEHIWFVRRFREGPERVEYLQDLAYAALYCQPRAHWAYGRRLMQEGHRLTEDGGDGSSFFLYASNTPIPRLVTEDAPPLPCFA